MGLPAGSRLGAYDIVGVIGAGGMGEVYRARDRKLNRDVAIKILPEPLARDADRLARFEREAQVLAALNHPHIAHIHGFDDSTGTPALVMELVEGPTLADRIAHGRIPVDETLAIARQIADALEAAHEHGIVHRDLKPANIKVRDDGTVKVLDFGLAKALDHLGAATPDVTQSPTLSVHATQAGIILGTAAYMSPEQARGKVVDKRADIWSFGVVLYEMLTGRRPFEGDDVSITLASVLKSEPDWTALPKEIPPRLRQLLRACLQKDPRRRLQAIGDARVQIEDLIGGEREDDGAATFSDDVPRWQRALPWAVASSAAVVATSAILLWAPWRNTVPRALVRVEVGLGVDASFDVTGSQAVTLSRDGNTIAFAAQVGGNAPQLYVRRLDQLQATPLAGTTNAQHPFFSPDGQWIGFFADRKLKKTPITGGAAATLGDAPIDRGGWWAEDGTIVFQPLAPGGVLQRVSAAGGAPTAVTTLADGEISHRWPQVLPGGRAILYTASQVNGNNSEATIDIQPMPSGPRKVLVRGSSFGRYLPSGHLVYVSDRTLFAAPFDLGRLEIAGSFLPVVEHLTSNTPGLAQIAFADTGIVAYFSGQGSRASAPMVWMDRDGKTTPLRTTAADWSSPRFSPAGRRLMMEINDGKQTDVWAYDWTRDAPTRLTVDVGDHLKPAWTPDGRRIVYRWLGPGGLFWRRADGSGDVQRLTRSPNPQFPGSWHPSERLLALVEFAPKTNWDLMILPVKGDEASGWAPDTPYPFLNSSANELAPAFSLDGRWIAYQSDESGRSEIYVRPFPGPGGKWQVSTDGGANPVWSVRRQQLLYAAPDNRIMTASYTAAADSFVSDKPTRWAEGRFSPRPRSTGGNTGSFDLSPDGDRVAIAAISETQGDAKPDTLVFIFNFFDELRRLAPPANPR